MSKKLTVNVGSRTHTYQADHFEVRHDEDTGHLSILGLNHENDVIVDATFAARRWDSIQLDDEKLRRGWDIWERCQRSHVHIDSTPEMGINDFGAHVIHSEDAVKDGLYRWSLVVDKERIPELIALLGSAYADTQKQEAPHA